LPRGSGLDHCHALDLGEAVAVARVFDDTVMMTRSARVPPVALRSEPSEVVQARDAKPRLSGQDAVHLLRFARLHVEDGAPEPHGDHDLEPVLDMSQ
jgi:hypothetical protein